MQGNPFVRFGIQVACHIHFEYETDEFLGLIKRWIFEENSSPSQNLKLHKNQRQRPIVPDPWVTFVS